jgi:hypothetical protein
MNYYLMILNGLHGMVASQAGNPEEQYSLASVVIHLSTCSVNPDSVKLPDMEEVIYNNLEDG